MTAKELFAKLAGNWEGTCRTWFQPDQLADESNVSGIIEPVLDGKFLRHTYQGTLQGKARHGEELLAFNTAGNKFEATWIDSFHMDYAIMFSQGDATEDGFRVRGEYAVGNNHPNWGWRTDFQLVDDDQLVITAYNVTPDGQEAKAVETRYQRVTPEGPTGA